MKKLLTILLLIMLIISFFQITNMYALYKEKIQGDYSTLLGVWMIKINETLITSSNGQVVNFDIADTQLQYVQSEYIEAGKIAPDGQAYFDFVIDPSNTDVSIIYEVSLGTMTTDSNASIQLISAENYFGQGENGQTNKTTNETQYTEGNLYTSVIPVDKITQGYKNYVRVYFKWVNNEDNNVNDSNLAGTDNSKISVPLQINLKQYTGEVVGNGEG